MILDQTVIAGLGNIYADECLALAGILPTRIANTLTRAEIEAVHEAANKVIAQGIANREEPLFVIIRMAKVIKVTIKIICLFMDVAANRVKPAVSL